MRYRRHTIRGASERNDPDLDSALNAMPAEDLRAFVRDVLDHLDDEPRVDLMDRLMTRAAKGKSGWRPSSPSARVVEEAKEFAEAARRVGQADPHDVDDYLRQGSKAFLAGELAAAREVFGALLPPIADGGIDLGQHEMVDEVLTIDEHECAVQYVVSVYTAAPIEGRPAAITDAINAVQGIASFWSPLEQMERVAVEPLPELDAFLAAWVKHLEQQPAPKCAWAGDRSRWLREAALRLEGVAGLERIARETKEPDGLRDWCRALVEREQWAEAMRAYDDAAQMVEESHWRGVFLDGAALAAQQLGRRDVTKCLRAAWLGAPTLVRLLRWLSAGGPAASTVLMRARQALEQCPTQSSRQLGLLHLLTGNMREAAKRLAKAPGLGWSRDGHPGHLLFPAFAGLLAKGTKAALSTALFAGLQQAPHDPWDWNCAERRAPKLDTPTIVDLIAVTGSNAKLDAKSRTAVLEAMRSAATKRVEGILGNKRRRHYGHAAMLVACCVELAPVAGRETPIAAWLEDLRKEYSRFYAFQEQLRGALASISS